MVRRGWILALISSTCLQTAGLAQAHPDFSGRWTLIPERSVFQHADGVGTYSALGTDFTITMDDPDTLILAIGGEVTHRWIVKLNGETTIHGLSGPDDRVVKTMVKSTWEGDTLVLTMEATETRGERVTTFTKRYRLTANSDRTLTVEGPGGEDGSLLASTYRWLEPM